MTQGDDRTLESWLGRGLERWVMASARNRRGVAILALLLFLGSLAMSVAWLGIRSETEALFPEDLPFRIRDARFKQSFPSQAGALALVIEGPSGEATREAAIRLADRLAERPELVSRVHLAQDPFFEEHGLLYRSVEELDAMSDRLARLQPLLSGLVADRTLRGLMEQTRLAVSALREDQTDGARIAPMLDRMGESIRPIPGHAAPDPSPGRLDWAGIVYSGQDSAGGARIESRDPRRRVVRVQPVLDYGSMSTAREAILAIRVLGDELGIVPEHGFRLRMTGDVALNFDEIALLRTQVTGAGVLSFVAVAALLYLALRSTRLVLATVLSLSFGLAVTAGVATLAIGHLNMISVAFAVLFIGLAVDFGIHFCMRFQELREAGAATDAALLESARGVGSSLLLCAVTTAVGFFAFVPTEFIGVAELGIIAGIGMFIGVFSALTLIPAVLIGAAGGDPMLARMPNLALPKWPGHRPRSVVLVSVVLVGAALALLPELRFDQNPLNVRDPSAESVQAYEDLLAESERSPWTLEFVAQDAAKAEAAARRFEAIPEVAAARTFADFIPRDQAAKLLVIEEMSYFTDWSAIVSRTAPVATDESIASLEGLRSELARLLDPEQRTQSIDEATLLAAERLEVALASMLVEIESLPAGERARSIDALEARLLGNFTDLLARLERAMQARPIRAEDLPPQIEADRVSSDGRHRVEILPAEDLAKPGALDRFVEATQRVTPELAGAAIRIHASARAVVRALERALVSAVVVILLFLFLLWRRFSDVLLVMFPLLSAATLTFASMVVCGIPFNFADVIVLPLLLGIGVDSGIHMVHRARIREDPREPLLETSTARAVVFSATTTIASFGTLALVPHQGIANLGQVLVIGVVWTVAANLVLLPALLALRSPAPSDDPRSAHA